MELVSEGQLEVRPQRHASVRLDDEIEAIYRQLEHWIVANDSGGEVQLLYGHVAGE